MKTYVTVLALVAAIGCHPKSVVAGTKGRGAAVVARSEATGWLTKKVVAKNPPETLLAEDGTICRLAPDRFRDTTVGALVHCNWQ